MDSSKLAISPPLIEDARRQVALFVECVYEPDDIVEIRRLRLRSARSTSCLASELPSMCGQLLAHNMRGENIYIGANPRATRDGKTAADVALARCLFVDFDKGITADVALQKIDAAGLPTPTLVLNSGHGAHCYWRLTQPLNELAKW